MLQHILLIVAYFAQWFISNLMYDDASMARWDKGSWQKKKVQVYAHCLHTDLSCLDIKRYTSTSRLQDRENDVKIVGAEI